MKYHHQISLHRRRKYLKRVYIFFAVLAAIAGLIVLAIRVDSYLRNSANTQEATTTEQKSTYFASGNKIFTSDYFYFQAPKNWVEVSSDSTNTKFVYRGLNDPIVDDELIIYVNDIPGDLSATKLLPVSLRTSGQELSPGSLSGHCNEATANDNIDERVVTYKKVRINCDVDNTQFNVLIGETGGSTRMTLNRPDGSTADYSILYRNVEATPDASELAQIMHSFQTR